MTICGLCGEKVLDKKLMKIRFIVFHCVILYNRIWIRKETLVNCLSDISNLNINETENVFFCEAVGSPDVICSDIKKILKQNFIIPN